MANAVSPNVYKILGESAALFASTFALSKTPLISWLNTPSTLEGLALCTGVQACASAASDTLNQIYNEERDTTYKVAFQIAGLVSSFALLTALAKPIATRTGMALNPYALLQLTAFHGIVKAIIHVGYEFAQSFSALKGISSLDDMKQIPATELGTRKKQFEDDKTETWDTYTLNMQAEFNAQLKANSQTLLPFTSLKTDGNLSKEELEVFTEVVGDKPTVEQAQVLVAHDVPPPKGCDVVPGTLASSVKVDDLSETALRWYHSAICQMSEEKRHELSSAQCKAFASAFYKLDLTSPGPRFALDTIPTSADGISKTQANYFFAYHLSHPTDYLNLEPKQQMVLREIFIAAGEAPWPITAPKKEDLETQSKEIFEQLNLQFDETTAEWDVLPTDYQKAYNAELDKHGLEARELTKQPWTTQKRVGYTVAGILVLIVIGTGVGMLAGAIPIPTLLSGGNNTNPTETPTPVSETPTPTPTPVSETPEYFDSGDQCIPMGTVFQVSTCANPFFNHTFSTQAKVNSTTGASTEQNPVTEEFSSDGTGLTDSGENYPVGFHWPSYEPPFVDDREQLESIDFYEVVYMRKDGVGSGEVDPTVVPSENAASEDFSSVGTGLGDVQEESQHDNSLLGKDIVVEKFDTPTHPIVPCANGYERTKDGCSPRITDNSTITELDPVTMQQFTLSTGEADQDGRVIEKTGTSTPPTDEKIVITGDQDLTEREVTVIETSDEASKTPTPSPTVVTGKDTSGDQDGAIRDTVSETENLDTPTPSPINGFTNNGVGYFRHIPAYNTSSTPLDISTEQKLVTEEFTSSSTLVSSDVNDIATRINNCSRVLLVDLANLTGSDLVSVEEGVTCVYEYDSRKSFETASSEVSYSQLWWTLVGLGITISTLNVARFALRLIGNLTKKSATVQGEVSKISLLHEDSPVEAINRIKQLAYRSFSGSNFVENSDSLNLKFLYALIYSSEEEPENINSDLSKLVSKVFLIAYKDFMKYQSRSTSLKLADYKTRDEQCKIAFAIGSNFLKELEDSGKENAFCPNQREVINVFDLNKAKDRSGHYGCQTLLKDFDENLVYLTGNIASKYLKVLGKDLVLTRDSFQKLKEPKKEPIFLRKSKCIQPKDKQTKVLDYWKREVGDLFPCIPQEDRSQTKAYLSGQLAAQKEYSLDEKRQIVNHLVKFYS
ncbi:hypothetical protein [Simkania sp.]|uniref:hypothetical protein n=1 Tax=Simkania sp. TaxID=34094 RepID=UPI003B524C2F